MVEVLPYISVKDDCIQLITSNKNGGALVLGGVCSWGGSGPGGCLLLGGVWSGGCLLWGGCLLRGVSALGWGVWSGGCLVQGVSALGGSAPGGGIPACTEADPPVWTEWMTDRCKNITLATTSLRPVINHNETGHTWTPHCRLGVHVWYTTNYGRLWDSNMGFCHTDVWVSH